MSDANHTEIDNQTPKDTTNQKTSGKLVISKQTKKLLKRRFPEKSSTQIITKRKLKNWRDKNNLTSNNKKSVRKNSIDSVNNINSINNVPAINPSRLLLGIQKANVLNKLQSLAAQKRLMLLHDLKKSSLNIMTINEKRSWFHSLGVIAGIDFDKERLLRGETTANIDIRSAVLSLTGEIDRIKNGDNVDISNTCESRASDYESAAQDNGNNINGGGGEEETPDAA